MIPLPRPGETITPMPGLQVWRNPGNGFLVIRTHYTADPARRGDWKYRASPKYGGLNSWRWQKEQEINWDATSGRLVFEMWNVETHLIRPFVIPEHWPRWILFDPAWTNPASLVWVAVDVDAEPNMLGYLPVHVYREFYRSKHSARACAKIAYDWSLRSDGQSLEWIEEIIVDPAAKQEHQGAAGDPENVNVRAATVLEQFEEQIRDLGWDVPVETGNNDKGPAIEEMIERLGCYWVDADGIPLYDEDDNFREPTLAELADGATRVPPTLFFHQTVVDGAREMAKYKWKDWASAQVAERHNAPETPVDKDDHTITNLIRFMNRLREFRPEGGVDLQEFQGRRKPREWKPIDQAARERHERAAARYRKRLRKLRQQ